MLDFLIPYAARRRLLQVLFVDGRVGSVSSLARFADVSAASANAELRAIERAGLAERRLLAGRLLYQAAVEHPHAALLRQLLQLPASSVAPAPDGDSDSDAHAQRTRNDLAAHGAALAGHRAVVRTRTPLEQALAHGVVLARNDVEVAQCLPALFARHARAIDFHALTAVLFELRHKHTAGFLLALAAELAHDPGLRAQAEALRDGRRKKVIQFFSPRAKPKQAEDEHTLPLALEWGFHFPMPLAKFGG